MTFYRRVCFALITVLLVIPAWAHFGKTTTKFPLQHAPAVKLGNEVKLTVQVTVPGATDEGKFLTTKMAAALNAAGVKVSPSASMEILVTLDKLDASVEENQVSMVLVTHTGDRDVFGGLKVPICKPDQVEVSQKEWLGKSELKLQVRDTKTNVVLATTSVSPETSYKTITPPSEVLKCDVKKQYAPKPGMPEDKVGLRRKLLDTAATDAARSLVGWKEEREAMLAICDELQPGNAKAMAGDIKGAIELWSNAQPGKTKHLLPYKDYNLAVGYALLAMAEDDTDDLQKELASAQQHYDAATSANMSEPGFAAFAVTLTELRTSAEARVAAAEQRQRETQQAIAQAEESKRWLRQPLDPAWFPAGENPELHSFRAAVRLRLEHVAEGGERAPALMDEFGRYAVRYNLNAGERNRVVNDEIARRKAVRDALGDYGNALRDMLRERRDHVLTTGDRAKLNQQLQILNLTPAMVTEVEKQEGVSPKSPAPGKS